jgi:chemotaxis response regulator CheB
MEAQTPNRKIIVVGGSAGSGPAFRAILAAVTVDLQAVIFVVIHRTLIGGADYVPSVLNGCGTLEATLARDGEMFEAGRVYVSPVGQYLLIERTKAKLERTLPGSSQNSIDRLFESAAISHGSQVIGVLLSGMLADGTSGLWHIRKHGGTTIVQDPTEAQYPSLPHTAMKSIPVDYCLRAGDIGVRLRDLVQSSTPKPAWKTGRIIIVEDDYLISADLESQLSDLGYAVLAVAGSGEDALRKAASIEADVAIMDVRLAGRMKGTEVARHLRERFQIPSIFVTAYSDMDTLSAAQASMPCAFLSKPYHASELNSAIQLALRSRESGD